MKLNRQAEHTAGYEGEQKKMQTVNAREEQDKEETPGKHGWH